MRHLFLILSLAALSCAGQMMQGIIGANPSGNANGYAKGAVFTFDTHPASSLTAFPNLISGTYPALADVAHSGYVTHTVTLNGQTVPADLIFTSNSAGSTLLSWEIESWDNTTGAIVAWVKADRSSSADTLIYAWVGKSSVTTYQCTATATWDSGYEGVWHLPNGGTLTAMDSTANPSNGTINGPTVGAGKIDGGALYDGATGRNIDVGNAAKLGGLAAFTSSGWIKPSGFGDDGESNLIGQPKTIGAYTAPYINQSLAVTPTEIGVQAANSSGVRGTLHAPTTISAGQWYYIAGTYDGTTIKAYINGTPLATTTTAVGIVTPSPPDTTFFLGQLGIGLVDYGQVNGSLDEVRISQVARSADWIAHEYTQQSQASAWYTVGGWGPIVQSFALAAVSSSELLASWTTDIPADSAVECGTTSGTYTVSSGTINPFSRGYGVTSHYMTVAGLAPSTLYHCKAISGANAGSTITSELSATTSTALTPGAISVTLDSAYARYNDQYPTNGRQMFGDSSYCTWSGDGKTYCSYQDCHLPNTTTYGDSIIFSWPTVSDLSYTSANLTNALTNSGTTFRTFGAFSIWDQASATSILYNSVFRAATEGDSSFIKSPDYGVHWIAPEHNTGPGVVGDTNGDFPSGTNCMICGSDWNHRLAPFQHCQDHHNCTGMTGNGRTYQYFFTGNYHLGLARMRVENATLQDGGLIEYYTGAHSADDGNFPAAWSPTFSSETLFAAGVYHFWPSAAWLPDFKKWLVVSWIETSEADVSPLGINIYTADYPWSIPVLIGTIPNPGSPAGFLPSFPNLQLATYTKTSSEPLTATIKMLVAGYFSGQTSDPTTNQYSAFTRTLTLTPAPPGPETVYITTGTTWSAATDGSNITVMAIGGGGAGQNASYQALGAGGGGAYATKSVAYTSGASVGIQIGQGGSTSGASGTDTVFNTTTPAVVAKGGAGGSWTNAGSGGLAADCTPSTGAHSGGSGGTSNGVWGYSSTGGGGGAGPSGAGKNGGSPTGDFTFPGGGGNGGGSATAGVAGAYLNGGQGGTASDGTAGGAGGVNSATLYGSPGANGSGGGSGAFAYSDAHGGAGGTGNEWDSTHGSGGGGGGGGGNGSTGYSGGAGGLYGGGGGTGGVGTGGFGTGANGIIVITYTPAP